MCGERERYLIVRGQPPSSSFAPRLRSSAYSQCGGAIKKSYSLLLSLLTKGNNTRTQYMQQQRSSFICATPKAIFLSIQSRVHFIFSFCFVFAAPHSTAVFFGSAVGRTGGNYLVRQMHKADKNRTHYCVEPAVYNIAPENPLSLSLQITSVCVYSGEFSV